MDKTLIARLTDYTERFYHSEDNTDLLREVIEELKQVQTNVTKKEKVMDTLVAKDILDFINEVMDNNSTSNYWLNKANIVRAYVKQAQTNAQQTHGEICSDCNGSKVAWHEQMRIYKFVYCPYCGRKLSPCEQVLERSKTNEK